MKHLSQYDPAWGAVKLGQSTLTMAKFGCTTTCMSMLTDYFEGYVSPPEIAHNAANYTPDGLVVWEKLKFPTMKFDSRERKLDKAKVALYLKDPNKAVILNVNNGAHWVVGLKKTLFGDSYVVLDPWGGVKVDANKKYRNVVGAAYFSKK